MHCVDSFKEEVVVCTSLCHTHHSHDILCKIKVLRISLISWSEECDEIVAACYLACDEEALNILDSLGDASCLNVILRSDHAEILDCILIYIDNLLRIKRTFLIKINSSAELEKEDICSCILLCLLYNIAKTSEKSLRIILHIVIHVESLVVE